MEKQEKPAPVMVVSQGWQSLASQTHPRFSGPRVLLCLLLLFYLFLLFLLLLPLTPLRAFSQQTSQLPKL